MAACVNKFCSIELHGKAKTDSMALCGFDMKPPLKAKQDYE